MAKVMAEFLAAYFRLIKRKNKRVLLYEPGSSRTNITQMSALSSSSSLQQHFSKIVFNDGTSADVLSNPK